MPGIRADFPDVFALIVGDPTLVLHAVALAMVAIAFLLIVILVPRGL